MMHLSQFWKWAPSTSLLEIRWETLGYDDQLSVIAVLLLFSVYLSVFESLWCVRPLHVSVCKLFY